MVARDCKRAERATRCAVVARDRRIARRVLEKYQKSSNLRLA